MTERVAKMPRKEGAAGVGGEGGKDDGPFSLLRSAQQTHTKILVSCRNDRRLLATLRAYDKHFNMILEDVHEISIDPKSRKRKNADGEQQELEYQTRFLATVFLRGDSVIFVLKVPADE